MSKSCGRYEAIIQKIALRGCVRVLEILPEKFDLFKLPLNQMNDDSILQVARECRFRVGPDVQGARFYLDVIRDMELSRMSLASRHASSI